MRAETTSTPSQPEQVLAAFAQARAHTLAIVQHLDDAQLERQISPIMSPLAWDLAHIAAYEDLWICERHGGVPLLRPDLARTYDAFETPRTVRGDIELLGAREAFAYLEAVRERSAGVLESAGPGDGAVCEMVVRHELQHCETMRQTLALGGLLSAGERAARDGADGLEGAHAGWRHVPGATFAMGAREHGFSYDNERPRHDVHVAPFSIARRPVTNASWMHFSEGGGYERREWWSSEGWAWKEQFDITHHELSRAAHPDAPVCHVSWFEADAFARAHGARLPTEAEWERAATRDQDDDSPADGACGALAATGRVWEWTSSRFGGYPGFRAHPYREYSEVFFGPRYRVLRGCSWATHARVASATFRNWDLPQRRQLFAGVRLARPA